MARADAVEDDNDRLQTAQGETMKRIVLIAVVVVIVLALAIQFVPVERTNPPVEADLIAPPEVTAVLRAACYDCHSNETQWPWYSHVAPVSWLVASDVEEARKHMNFSRWGSFEVRKQARLQEEIWEEVSDGEMPPLMYRAAHPGGRLSDAQRATLRAWVPAEDD